MGNQSDIADRAELKRVADWARACVWPVEVVDARLGKSAREFMAAASPAVVLDLLADIEALQGLYRMHQQTETREMLRLKAEIERRGIELYEANIDNSKVRGMNGLLYAEIGQLKGESEALRKDAERYRWMRNQLGRPVCRINGVWHNDTWLDQAVDAATSRGEQY